MTVTRRAAWRSGAQNGWHDDWIWYAAAINRMKALTPRLAEFQTTLRQALVQGDVTPVEPQLAAIARQWSDPASLGYQSQVHGTYVETARWPRIGQRRALWKECAHNHWFFLPWHRAYLLEFERVCAAHITALGGPGDTWGLPYWNYSDHATAPERLGLPRPLRDQFLPTGVTVRGVTASANGRFPNPLFDPTRVMTGNVSATSGTAWATATIALLRPHYANNEDTGQVSFGGGVLDSPNNAAQFHRADEIGQLDSQPHGSVHNQVGGSMWMFETAALDPVFWVHHCNIDRLWETYAKTLGHGYPFQTAADPAGAARTSWTQKTFQFLRTDGTVKTWKSPELIDVTTLGYSYDSIAAPRLPPTPPTPPPGSSVAPFGLQERGPEPISEARAVTLDAEAEVNVSAGDTVAAGELVVAGFPAGARWIIRCAGLRAVRPAPTSYEVYLGLAPGDAADADDATHYVGLLSLFGVFESSRDSSGANGQTRLFDATEQISALGDSFDVGHATVRFVALNADRDLAQAELTIERVTLEVAAG